MRGRRNHGRSSSRDIVSRSSRAKARMGCAEVTKLSDGRVGANAHVVAVNAATHRSYFPLKNVDGRPILRIIALR